jgi:PAS domain S-box-containing protein
MKKPKNSRSKSPTSKFKLPLGSEQILDALMEHVVYQDTENTIIWANKSAVESVGLTLEKLVGRHCYEIWPKRTQPCIDCPVIMAGKTKQPQKGELATPDGRVWFIRGYPIIDDKGNLEGIIEITLEVTEEKKAEENFRSLAEQSPNMIFINDKGRVVYVNQKCEEIMGYTKDEFYSETFDFRRLIAPEYLDLVSSAFQKHMQGEEVLPYEYALVTKNGKRLDAIITTKLIDYKNSKAILGIITDITDRKKNEVEMRKSKTELQKKVKELEDFYDMAVGRELRMKELKEENKELKEELKKYKKQ